MTIKPLLWYAEFEFYKRFFNVHRKCKKQKLFKKQNVFLDSLKIKKTFSCFSVGKLFKEELSVFTFCYNMYAKTLWSIETKWRTNSPTYMFSDLHTPSAIFQISNWHGTFLSNNHIFVYIHANAIYLHLLFTIWIQLHVIARNFVEPLLTVVTCVMALDGISLKAIRETVSKCFIF